MVIETIVDKEHVFSLATLMTGNSSGMFYDGEDL